MPKDHPLRTIKKVADQALERLSGEFDGMYSDVGRASVPTEQCAASGPSARSWNTICCSLVFGHEPDGEQLRPGNPWVDFRGEKLKNETHRSRTNPEARLMRKGKGREAKLSFMGRALIGEQERALDGLRGEQCDGDS